MSVKHLIAGIAVVAAISAIGGLAYTVRMRDNTIASLRQAVEDAGKNPDSIYVPPRIYEPVTVNHFYERRGHKILLSDDTFGQIWLPVLADVPLSTHPVEKMVETDRGRMLSFDDAGNLNAMTGVDISEFNVVTDWSALKEDGIDFVILRLGYRGYGIGTGKLKKDSKFQEHYRCAKEAGLLVGAYFFSQAITEEEAAEEAILSAQMLEGCELDFPVVYDWELIFHDNEGARTDNVPVDVLTDCTLAFCQNIESFGYRPMIYQNKRTSLFKLDLPRLTDYPFWLAEYGDGPTYIYNYDMWQYTCTGQVNGIEGNVDIDLCFKDFSKEGDPPICLPAPAYTPKSEAAETTAPAAEDAEAEDADEADNADADGETDEETAGDEQPAAEEAAG